MPTDATLLAVGVEGRGIKETDRDLEHLTQTASKSEEAAGRQLQAWQRQADTLGKTRAQVMLYDASQLNLSRTQMEAAAAAIRTVDAYDRQQQALTRLRSEAREIGIVLGAATAAMGLLVHQALAFNARLNEMAQETGVAASTLGGLGFAATQSGTNLDRLVQGLGRMSDRVQAAAQGNKQAAATFEAMGISIKSSDGALKDQYTLLGDLADKFKSYNDGTNKAALAQDLFGKGGRELIPLLNKGRDGIAELVEKYKELGGVTDAQSERANAFNDLMAASRMKTQALVGQFVDGLIPALTQLVGSFEGASGGARAFNQAGQETGQFLVFIGNNVQTLIAAFTQLGKAIGLAAFVLSTLGESGGFYKAKAAINDFIADVNKLDERIATSQRNAAALAAQARAGLTGSANADQNDRLIASMERATKTAAPLVAAVEKVKKAHKEAADETLKWSAVILSLSDALAKDQLSLDANLASLQAYGVEAKATASEVLEFELAHGKLAAILKVVGAVNQEMVLWIEATLRAQARQKDETLIDIEAWKEYTKAVKAHTDELAKGVQAIVDEIAKEERRGQEIGLTREQILALTIAEDEHTLSVLRGIEGADDDVRAMELRIQKNKELQAQVAKTDGIQKQRDAWVDLFKTASDMGAQFITDFIEHGSSAFKNLWENFKHWAIEAFAKIAAQQIIVNIAGSFGGVAGSAASSLSGGSGGLGSIFNMMGGGGGGALAGIGGWLSGMGGAIGAFGSTLGAGFSAGIATLGIAAEAGTAAIGGLASAMGAMAAVAIPVVGWIAAIGIALYAAFGQKGGGPKSGGFAQSGAGVMIGGDNNRYFTPNQSDADIQKATDQLLTSYNGILTALGGKGQAGFALGYDSDPKGTAPNRVSSGAFVNGQQVYGTHDVGVGRDADQLQAALALEGKRVVLAALQASDLPEYLSKILDSVKVDTASSAAIDQVLAEAAALKAAVDVFGQLGDQFNKLDPDQIKGLLDAFGGIDNFTKAFQYLNDNFLTTADKHATDVKNLTDAFTSLGMQVPKDHQAYLDLLNAQDLSTDAGRQLYAQLVALAPAFVAVAGTAEQAAQALRQQVQAAEQVFNQNFFTQQERDAQAATTAWDQVHQAWAENAIALHALGFDHIPTTTAGFRQLIGSIDRSTAAGEALYQSMIVLAPGIVSINTAVGDLSDTSATAGTVISNAADQISQHISDLQDAAGKAQTAFSAILSAIDDVSNSGTGDFGDKLTTKITLLREQSDKYQALLAAQLNGPDPYGVLAVAYRNMLQQLSGLQSTATDQLTRFTILKAQYGGAIAEQLVQLQDWYKTQQALFGGNVDALSALQTVFDQKWKAIVDGTGNAVNQASDQMAKLRQSILDYVKGLQVSDISPLTPAQKLAQAQQQYNDRLHQAQGGNTDAMGDITRYSDTYLHIARDFFASSSAYTDIFGEVTRQLTALGSPTNGTVMPDAQTKLASALPDAGGKLASQDDLKQLAAVVEQMGATVRDAVVGASPKAKIGALQRSLETTVTK
jgi:hypothetical protein